VKARPSTKYYCEPCGEDHPGRPTQTEAPIFQGCCWDLEWTGTREQAGELYDYLLSSGMLATREKCANGAIGYCEDDIGSVYTVWVCGECGEEYAENDDGKEQAITCCAQVLEARKAEIMEEEGV
jgi:DNA-directed RNA polymerase subunit RPC12/RpoP